MRSDLPYFHLSAYYFAYFATLGAFVPYWTVYLKDQLGFSAIQIGQLMAVFMLSKIIAPIVWGGLVDHSGKRLLMIRLAAGLSVLCFIGVYLDQSFLWIALVMVSFGFFWNASLPQFEALTLNHLGEQSQRYSQIRLWGSLGFILVVIALPWLFNPVTDYMVEVTLLGFLLIFLTTWLVRDCHKKVALHEGVSLKQVLRHPLIITLLVVGALQQASHSAYYNFFTIYLTDNDYPVTSIGWLWAVGVMAEVGLFIWMHRFIERFGAIFLFTLSILLTGIRWLVMASLVDQASILTLSQCLHAASYALFHASSIYILHHYVPAAFQGLGQALYTAVSFGLGGALGSLLSGYTWQWLGAEQTFYMSALLALVGWVMALFYMKDKKQYE